MRLGTYEPEWMEPIEEGVTEDQHLIKEAGNLYYGQLDEKTRVAHGYGVWLHASGKTVYEGQFKNGKFHGLARIIYSSGHFEGSFSDGVKNGPGTFV